jgi:hypothetical protein
MKKIFLLMMLLVPVLGFSQRDAQGGLSKEEQQKSSAEIYLSMALTENQGRVSVKLDFGKTISEIVTDKMILVEIEELSKMRFDSVIEAMNTLASYGWELEESYSIETRTGALTFIVFAKEVDRLKRAAVGPSTKPSIQSKGGKTPAKK